MTIATLIEDNLAAFMRTLGTSSPRYELHDGSDLVWTLSDVPFALMNSLVRTRVAAPEIPQAIAAAIARARTKNVPLLWWVSPSTNAENLGPALIASGFEIGADMPGMAIALDAVEAAPLPPDLRIERVASTSDATTWCAVLAEAFHLPDAARDAFEDLLVHLGFAADAPMQNYLGFWHGAPAATSTLFRGGGVAGIYDVATLPSARRRGIGAAMTVRALLDAKAAGDSTAILQASDDGAPLYRALGFVEHCRIITHVRPAPSRPDV